MRKILFKLLSTAVVILMAQGMSAQTIMYWSQFEGNAGPAPLPGPDPTIIREANTFNVQINNIQPNSPNNALSQFSYRDMGGNYMMFNAHTPGINVTAGKWYLIEIYVSDNSTAADFNLSSINTAPTAWDDFDTDSSRVRHLRSTNIEPDPYTKWEVLWYCPATETRYFAIHEDFLQGGMTDNSEAFLDDWKITEWDCPVSITGPGGAPTNDQDIASDATPSALDFCDLSGYEYYDYGGYRKDMGLRGELVFTGDATDTWMTDAANDCWASTSTYGYNYNVVAYEIPPSPDTVYISIDNIRTDGSSVFGATPGTNELDIYITDATCSSPTGLYCTANFTGGTITLPPVPTGAYIYMTESYALARTLGWEDGNVTPTDTSFMCLFDICIDTVAGTCDIPLTYVNECQSAGDAIAVYAPDDGGGNVDCNELDGVGGSPDGSGLMYTTDAGTTESGSSAAISGYSIVTADNFSCTTTDITLTNAGNDWTNLDGANIVSGESLPTGVSPIEIDYDLGDFGRKTLTSDVDYCDFLFMQVDQVPAGAILGVDDVCPDTFRFTSSDAGTPGYTYEWFVSDPANGTSEIFTDTAASTRIAFENTGTDTIRFVVKLLITSECCGPLDTVRFNTDVFPRPATPGVITPDTTCVGGFDTLDVSPNLSSSGYSYNWYGPNTSTPINPGSDPRYSSVNGNLYVDSTLFGSNYYKVEAVDFNGCVSAGRDSVEHVGTYYLPVVDTIFPCNAGCNPICVQNPIAGATYRWYSDVGLGAADLEQQGLSTCYSICTDTATLTGAVWVTVQDNASGCNETTPGERGDAIVTGSYTALNFYNFTGDNDWYNGRNWSERAPGALLGDGSDTAYCIPSCGVNAFIRADCEISSIGNPTAACNDLFLLNGNRLEFMDDFAHLEICRNMIMQPSGDLIMVDTNGLGIGKVSFVGTDGPQRFINLNSANRFNDVEINNTSATPLVYLVADGHQDFVVRSDGRLFLRNGILTPDPSPFSGALTANTRKVIVQNPDANAVQAYSANSYVDGTLDRYIVAGNDYVFPVGNDVSYQRFDLDNVNSVSGGMNELNVRFDLTNADLGRALQDSAGLGTLGDQLFTPAVTNMFILDNGANDGADNGIWTATPDVGGCNYNVNLWGTYYAKVDTIWMTAVKRDANFTAYPTLTPAPVGDWTIESSTDNPTAGVAGTLAIGSRTGYSGFSQFAIAVAPVLPLPVEMLYFNGHARDQMVHLDWKTINENNNDHFTIQRSKSPSANSSDWEDVGVVDGNGTTSASNEYKFIDTDPMEGTSFYRLMVFNKRGESYPTRVVKVNFDRKYQFKVYPNPASDNIELRISAVKAGNATVNVYNSLGAMVESKPIMIDEGNSSVKFNLKGYSSGVYHMKVKTDEALENITFIVE